MAAIYSYRKAFRVVFTLMLPSGSVRRSRYPRARQEGRNLCRQLERLEEAVRVGMAPLGEIEDWLGRKWLTQAEALEAFRAYRESVPDLKGGEEAVNFDAILAAYEEYALTNSKAGNSHRKSHKNHINLARQVLAWLAEEHPTLDLREGDVQRWVDALGERYSDWTVRHQLTKLRLLLDQAISLGMTRTNPARAITVGMPRRQQARVVLAVEDAQQLLEVSLCHRHRISSGLPTVVRLGLYGGLRDEEMCLAQWSWLDFKRGLLTIPREVSSPTGELWKPKDAEARTLDLKREVMAYLAEEQERLKDYGFPFLIPGGNQHNKQHFKNRPIGSSALQNAFRDMIAAEKMDPRFTIYSLRHTYATTLLRSGVDLATVSARLGHADIRTTMAYLHSMEPDKHATDALPY